MPYYIIDVEKGKVRKMISFYMEETETPVAKEKYFVLWMEKDGKKFFIDDVWHCFVEETDERFQKKMAQLYSTGGAYFGSEDDIVEFTDRIRNNEYHLEARSNLKFGDDIGNNNYYIFFGEIAETNEGFYFCIYDIMSPEISRAKIALLLKERKI